MPPTPFDRASANGPSFNANGNLPVTASHYRNISMGGASTKSNISLGGGGGAEAALYGGGAGGGGGSLVSVSYDPVSQGPVLARHPMSTFIRR